MWLLVENISGDGLVDGALGEELSACTVTQSGAGIPCARSSSQILRVLLFFDTAFPYVYAEVATVIQCLIVTIQTTKSNKYSAHGTSRNMFLKEQLGFVR